MIDNAVNLNCAKRAADCRALLGKQSPSSLPSKHAKIRKSVGSVAEARPSASRCLSEKFPTDLADSSLDYHPPPSSSSAFKSPLENYMESQKQKLAQRKKKKLNCPTG